ncbi:MAG: DUF2169 domain-containing protein [Thermodesulfobacteriota bacterium]
MKIFKSDELNLLFRVYVQEGRCLLSASVMGFFALTGEKGPSLLPALEMWPVAAEALGEEVLDLGLPKKRGEFLVYGQAFASKPVKSLLVKIVVGPKTKELTVTGDRFWQTAGLSASEPAPFSKMKICFANAYGRPDFPRNPLGKGRVRDENGRRPLPNIQDTRSLVASPDDEPPPAGLTAYQLTWPQRTRFLPKISADYLLEDWPYFPRGTDLEYFNTAPEDQRLDGFFQGEEKIEIHNMHPEKPVLRSVLPSVRPRLFIHRIEDGSGFEEISLHLETVFLFPDRERGIVLYRGLTTCRYEDYEDIGHCLAEVEKSADTPGSLEHYREKFMILLNPDQKPPPEEKKPEPEPPVAETPPEAQTAPEPPPPKEKTPEELEHEALLQKLEDYKAQALENIRKAGHDPDEFLKKLILVEEEETPLGPLDLEKKLAELKQHAEVMLAKLGMTREEMAKMVEGLERKPPTPKQALETMRAAGMNNPKIEEALLELDKVYQAQEAEKAREEIESAPKGPSAGKVHEDTGIPKGPRDGAEALAWHSGGKSLAGQDLSGFDCSGMDFSGADFNHALLEGTNFSQADLRGAIFTGAVLLKTNFSSANLEKAHLNEVTAAEATFTAARLGEANLSAGDFAKADFTEADLTKALAAEASFESAGMERVKAVELSAPRALFETADMAGADFSRADLTAALLLNVNINGANLSGIKASGLRLNGASGEKANFKDAALSASRVDEKTNLSGALFDRADLSAARWAGACLAGASMIEAVLDRADFSRADLSSARLARASARETEFTKAKFNGADLSKINLLKGSLRMADLVKADLSAANLYGVDFYKAKLGDTKTSRANLKNTLLKLKP